MKDDGYLNEIESDSVIESDPEVVSENLCVDSDSELDDSTDSVMESAFSIHTPPRVDEEEPLIEAISEPVDEPEPVEGAVDDLADDPALENSEKINLDQVDIAHLSASDSGGDSVAIPQSVLGSISVDVRVELGETMINLNQLYALREGQILELDRELGAPLDVVVNGQVIAKCEIVSINYRYAIRIIELINTQ
ncbi:FliM/FliN family flagellar motor switch protein [Candidatus Marinamargulisbacteria bacterium]|jgi:flagellar motor switch protein FliN/FliY|nr:FliM/FliN family flagellar motor switch protein [Candidatus Marinamargulisbacteria bacterium]